MSPSHVNPHTSTPDPHVTLLVACMSHSYLNHLSCVHVVHSQVTFLICVSHSHVTRLVYLGCNHLQRTSIVV